MRQYLDLMQNVLDNGTWQQNRTGIRTKMIPGAMVQFDLRNGFPAMTTKSLAFKAVGGELVGFLRGCNTAKQFNDLGCKVWDANATAPAWLNNPHYVNKLHEEDGGELVSSGFLGRIYGQQWRDWKRSDGGSLDQLAGLIEQIKRDPTSRRMLITAWRPDELDQMALPPCHYGWQVIIEQESKTMHLLWNQRSVDMFLGLPFNIASYAALLSLLAQVTGYRVGTLTGFLADVHIYENHLEQCALQLSREPLPLCKLHIDDSIQEGSSLFDIRPDQFRLDESYQSHPSIKAVMAV